MAGCVAEPRALLAHELFIVLGMAVATAVMTGSLLVGDSMTASLREKCWRRLGEARGVDEVPATRFPADLGSELRSEGS